MARMGFVGWHYLPLPITSLSVPAFILPWVHIPATPATITLHMPPSEPLASKSTQQVNERILIRREQTGVPGRLTCPYH